MTCQSFTLVSEIIVGDRDADYVKIREASPQNFSLHFDMLRANSHHRSSTAFIVVQNPKRQRQNRIPEPRFRRCFCTLSFLQTNYAQLKFFFSCANLKMVFCNAKVNLRVKAEPGPCRYPVSVQKKTNFCWFIAVAQAVRRQFHFGTTSEQVPMPSSHLIGILSYGKIPVCFHTPAQSQYTAFHPNLQHRRI